MNISTGEEEVIFKARIGEVVNTKQVDGRVFERYRRSPGVRLIIVTPQGKLLLTREHRQESDSVDLRLPGGKVCDSLESYRELLASGRDVAEAAKDAAIVEGAEEAGIAVNSARFVVKAPAGATVEWDLYYFITDDYTVHEKGQNLGQGEEDITTVELTFAELRKAIADGQMHEWRSVGVLLGAALPKLEANAHT